MKTGSAFDASRMGSSCHRSAMVACGTRKHGSGAARGTATSADAPEEAARRAVQSMLSVALVSRGRGAKEGWRFPRTFARYINPSFFLLIVNHSGVGLRTANGATHGLTRARAQRDSAPASDGRDAPPRPPERHAGDDGSFCDGRDECA